LGYNTLKADCEIKALVQNNQEVKEVSSGKFELVANQTPFYGECGGQVGDMGVIRSNNFSAKVVDCKRKLNDVFVHVCELEQGTVKVGEFANFEVAKENRSRICANHSVTHLAHKALKLVLGDHVAQKGSLVEAGRMRFDVSHPKQITAEQIRRVEDIVNEQIRNDLKVRTVIMNKDEAVKLGAMALFDEKYGDDVRVVTMGDENEPFSRELCGGTHVSSTGNIGYFHILSESAVAAGVRRLECVTGYGADMYVRELEDKLHKAAGSLKTNVNDLENRINGLLEERKKMEAEIFSLKKSLAGGQGGAKDEIESVNGVKFVGKLVPDAHPKELKSFVDDIFQKLDSGVVALCSDKDGKASIVVGVSKDLTTKYNAVELVRAAAVVLGGQGGGGRADMAQAGGTDVSKITEALAKVKELIA
ncbi:MAG: alanine--tRNA ligase, partial [Alphaproteobacteria bacterium]|nr:alanine--tRNA ligase [Alphaproteobacteria bacterium]